MKIAVEVRGAGKAAVNLHRLGERGADVRPVSEKVRSVYRKSTERRFRTRGEGAWPPLAGSTMERKQRQGLDPRPLRATEKLYRALTSPRAAGQVDVRDRSEFRFGTTLPYARFHDTGSGGVPRRELIELTPAERREVTKLISGHVANRSGR
jgi:phage gpG-like protein